MELEQVRTDVRARDLDVEREGHTGTRGLGTPDRLRDLRLGVERARRDEDAARRADDERDRLLERLPHERRRLCRGEPADENGADADTGGNEWSLRRRRRGRRRGGRRDRGRRLGRRRPCLGSGRAGGGKEWGNEAEDGK